ncbi:hypothetical protein EEL49_07265 [Muribaculaceae bacterium Isolate-104 (HZI)]|mgnify:FL=1|nr:hypothetical protein EEL49_07265 [Muribaculaceae bacterium Isolate-104 (HZI)]
MKKEKSLLEKALAKEEVDLSRYTLTEIKDTLTKLVEAQESRIRKAEVVKLLDVVAKATEKIREVVNKE